MESANARLEGVVIRLPACFVALRTALEGRHGDLAGSRQFIQVLQLLNTHPQPRVERVIRECQIASSLAAEVIVQRVESLAAAEAVGIDARSFSSGVGLPSGVGVGVPPPDLSRFNHLLDGAGAAEARPGINDMPC